MTSTKHFIVSNGLKREERDAGSSATRRFFKWGQTINGISYFYSSCRPDSITEMIDGSGVVQAQYSFDPFGRSSKLQGSLEADFQYAGYYMHQRSGLSLPVFRAYSAKMGRWISRDPLYESGGLNLFCYVNNNPSRFTDKLGLERSTSFKIDRQEIWEDTQDVGLAMGFQARQDSITAAEGAAATGLNGAIGGPQDAYRHCLWACLMTKRFGPADAMAILNNHEEAGRRMGQSAPDEAMDTANNKEGVKAADCDKPCEDTCRKLLNSGQLHGKGGAPMPMYGPGF